MNRRAYRIVRIVCVVDLALAAMVLHAAPDGWPLPFAQASIGLCVVIGVVATQRLRQGVRV